MAAQVTVTHSINIAGRDIYHINSNQDPETRQRLVQECRDITEWLSPLNFKASQSKFLQTRERGTGEWLLESETFLGWRDGDPQILWCPGNAGVGKTILAAIVVNHLQTRFMDGNVGVAVIYCNYKERTTQTVPHLVASLLKQLVQDCGEISDNIKSFYNRHTIRQTEPTLDETIETWEIEVKNYTKIFIIVDALDECIAANATRIRLLAALKSLTGPIKLMVTSRLCPFIEQYFHEAQRIDISATKEDVTIYVQRQLTNCPGLMVLQDTITEKIVNNVKGMFLLARLHMDALLEQESEKDVRKALDSLPNEIGAIYNEAMERIERQPNTSELAKRILAWVAYAHRPLSVEELQYALAISSGLTEMNAQSAIFEWKLPLCAGLIVIDREQRTVRLAHYTTQRYIEDQRESRFPDAEAMIAEACLRYLSSNVCFCKDDAEFESLLKQHPFLEYAASNWGRHACRHQEKESVKSLALDLLQNDVKVALISQVMLVPSYHWGQHFTTCFTGVHISSYFGLKQILDHQLKNGANANVTDRNGRTPLSYAAEHGHEEVVRLLLARDDVPVDSRDCAGRRPLSYAAENGNEAVFRLFLDRDDRVDLKDEIGRSPLSYAAANGNAAVVKLLLSRDDVQGDSRDETGWSSLSYATENGQGEVVKLLLSHGDVRVNLKDGSGKTLLSRAARNGYKAIEELLMGALA